MTQTARPFRLAPFFSPRIWGQTDWTRWYPEASFAEPVGEAWLTGPECVIETGPWAGQRFADAVAQNAAAILGESATQDEFPLLLKILAPREKLSVQVHPDDAFARQKGYPRGKTECWYILEAKPGAEIALGLQEGVDGDAVRRAVAGQTMEKLLAWVPVHKGEMFFVDAGTVHAIGPDMTILETQQTCDITYRLYDYGRPRELHVDDALHVMKSRTRAGLVAPASKVDYTRLIEERYFAVDKFALNMTSRSFDALKVPQIFVGLDGTASLESDAGSIALEKGKAIVVPAHVSCTIRTSLQAEFTRALPD